MATPQKAGSHAFEPTAGESQWWDGLGESLPEWRLGMPHPWLHIEPNLLDAEQCDTLIGCFERHREHLAARTGAEFWDGRYLWSDALPRSELNALRLMQQLRHYSTLKLMQRFSPQQMLYSDTAQLVCWPPGRELRPHADNIEPDGRPNGTPHRSWSSLLYLNDDYEGGHTYFPGHGLRIRPQRGCLVLFGSGCDYVHGVTGVTKGLRYTYAGWFTHDPERRDRSAQLIY